MGLLGDLILSEYVDRKRAKQAEQLEGLLGQKYQPGAGQGMVENTGLLGGEMNPQEFAARMMAIPGYQGAGERIFSGIAQQQMRNDQSAANTDATLNTLTPYQEIQARISQGKAWIDNNRQKVKDIFQMDTKSADQYLTRIKPYQAMRDIYQDVTGMVSNAGGVNKLNPQEAESTLRRMLKMVSGEAFMADDREAETAKRGLQERLDSMLSQIGGGGAITPSDVTEILRTMSGLAIHSEERIRTINKQAEAFRGQYGIPTRPFGYVDPGTRLEQGTGGRQTGSGSLVPGGASGPPPTPAQFGTGAMTREEGMHILQTQGDAPDWSDSVWDWMKGEHQVRPGYR